MISLIKKKRDGQELDSKDIAELVERICDPRTPTFQMSAMLMAIYLKGMTLNETTLLAKAMADSGDQIDLSKLPGPTFDKHSTGGVGDKTTLIIVPLLASVGIQILKLSGKALAHTGGTLDKLQSFTGINLHPNISTLVNQVNDIGCAIAGQSASLVPADEIMYRLRDQTGTVSSIPLIASSIMSKKIAAGADHLLLDVKVGSGANITKYSDNQELAKTMVSIGNNLGITTEAILTNMAMPLGRAIGNSLEVKEALEVLGNGGSKNLRAYCLDCCCIALELCGLKNRSDNQRNLEANLSNGKAIEIFRKMIELQGGSTKLFHQNLTNSDSPHQTTIYAKQDGYICKMNARAFGEVSSLCSQKPDGNSIDLNAGIYLHKTVGDYVQTNQPICTIYSFTPENLSTGLAEIKKAIKINDSLPSENKLILERIN
ncbi:MAG: thymidine phosphorylase [Saprospiraceae bacterium]|nr:thymidine phosphorylase [Saprospiraceae bacterium]